MHLERCTPLQRKPYGLIVSCLQALGKVRKNVIVGAFRPGGRRRGGSIALEEFAGIQQDGYRTFIDQFDAHCFLETAGFAAQARSLNLPDE